MSFSNYGEDAMLSGLLSRISHINEIDLFAKNTYIDIGCYQPIIANNTYFLYKLGWTGTLVEPNPNLSDLIRGERPLDTFLPYAIDSTDGTKTFFIFDNEHQCNTLDEDFVDAITKYKDIEIKETISIESKTLDYVFDNHYGTFGTVPMIVNIDIEGRDMSVLASYSFKHRPLFFVIEDEILGAFKESDIFKLMDSNNYELVSGNFLTAIYMDRNNPLFQSITDLGRKK